MQIKQPPIYDVSHWEEIPDFTKVSPRPVLFITKATEGITYKDDKFIRFFGGMKQIGVLRGAYHFFRQAYNSVAQAKFFLGFVGQFITYKDLLILDVEEGGETAPMLQDWLEYVRTERPNNQIIIYSRKNILDSILMTSTQRAYFKTFSIWTAGYPYFPDQYSTPPASYIPDQTRFGPVVLWQYSDKGIVSGIQGYVDVNWIDPVFLEKMNGLPDPPPPPTDDTILSEREYFLGAIEKRCETITTHGKAIYNLTEILTEKVEKFFISPQLQSRQYVPKFLEDYDLHFAINCDGWTTPPLIPTGYNASEGHPYGITGNEETVYVSKDNTFSLTRPASIWNAFSFQNRLIKDGVIPVINKSVDDIRARTAIGYTQDQSKVYLITVDGGDQYSKEGLNFQETAAILLKLGCYQAFMLDGGGSTAKVVEDHGVKVIGLTSGEDLVLQYGALLRRVLNIFGLQMKDGTVEPPTGETMTHKVLVAVKPRIEHSMYANSASVNLAVGTEFESTISFIVNDPSRVDNGVTFVQIIGGTYNQYWVPLIYKSVEYVKALDVVVPPPTTVWPDKLTAHYGTETKNYFPNA